MDFPRSSFLYLHHISGASISKTRDRKFFSLTLPKLSYLQSIFTFPSLSFTSSASYLRNRCHYLEHNYVRFSIKRGSDLSCIKCCDVFALVKLENPEGRHRARCWPGMFNFKVLVTANSFAQ